MATTSTRDNHELRDLQSIPLDLEADVQSTTLPRVDGGKDAWLALAGCFMLEGLVWGFPFAFGVFQRYYRAHEPFKNDPSVIAAISTTASGLMFISSPLVALALQRYPRIRRPASFVGLAITVLSLIVASFAQNTATLLATQGVMYALGGLTLYFPAMYVIDEWFVARKGLAFGVVWTGTGVSGAIVPFLLEWLLGSYGFRTALRVWAVILLTLALPSVWVMKSRLPVSGSGRLRPTDLSFMKRGAFWMFEVGNVMQSLSYFVPQLWIPSFAASLGFPSFSGPLALCLLNIAACGGYLVQGMLVDRFHVTVAIAVATIGATLAVFLLWGFTTSQAMLYVFAIIWGLSGGGYAACWSGCAKAMRNSSANLDTGLVISLMCAGKGIASLISGPLSEQLLRAGDWKHAQFAYGSHYGLLIVFAGVAAMLGGTACIGKLFKVL